MSFALAFAALAFVASALTTSVSLWKLGASARTTLKNLDQPAKGEATGSIVVAQEVGYRTRIGRSFSVVDVRTTAPVEVWTQPSDWDRGQVEIEENGVHRMRRQRKLHLTGRDFVFQTPTIWSTYDPRPSLRRTSIGCFASAIVSLLGVAAVAVLSLRAMPEVAAVWALTQFLAMPLVENTLTERCRAPNVGGRTFLETT